MQRKKLWLSMMVLAGLLAFAQSAPAGVWAGIRFGPPPARREIVAARPGWFLARGHWGWDRARYHWIPGRWIAERPGHRWVEGRWYHRHDGWGYRDGYWRGRR